MFLTSDFLCLGNNSLSCHAFCVADDKKNKQDCLRKEEEIPLQTAFITSRFCLNKPAFHVQGRRP